MMTTHPFSRDRLFFRLTDEQYAEAIKSLSTATVQGLVLLDREWPHVVSAFLVNIVEDYWQELGYE